MSQKNLTGKRTDFRKKTSRAVLAGLLGSLLLLLGIIPFPALHGQNQGQTQIPPQVAGQTAPLGQVPQPQAKPQPVKLSILLLMDVSGSMADNTKIDQAKEAAIKAISGALKAVPAPAPNAQQPGGTTPPVVIPHAPGIPVHIAQAFDKNLTALEELQKALGPDIRNWLTKAEAGEMGKIIQNCNELMKGLAFEQQSELMRRLNPLVENMHYSIAAKVNQELGGGLKYVLPGKTPSNPEFGGLYTLKPSDHDAIYLGAADKADEAMKLHQKLAQTYGDDFLKTTESCLESSRFTLEPLPSGAVPQSWEKFSGAGSNLDWMRTKSGSTWVREYVDKAGKVVDLDKLDDATKTADAMRPLSSFGKDELQNLGVSLDRTSLKSLGYNLGLQSDFERQLALNKARKALEKGLAAPTTEDTAMLLAKYGKDRIGEVAKGAGIDLETTSWKGYLDKVTEVGKKAKHGDALEAADKAVVDKFDDFAKYVREQSLANQMNRYSSIEKAWTEAFQRGDKAGANALRTQMTELLDDAQGALHNYQQVLGTDAVDKMVQQVAQGQDRMGTVLSKRLAEQPWVSPEPSIGECVGGPGPGAAAPGKLVISDAKTMLEYAKANPGHVFAKAAQYGAYIYVGYEFNNLLTEGKYDEAVDLAKTTGEIEAGNFIMTKLLTPKFGPWGGPAVTLAATLGLAIGEGISNSMINGQVNDMTLSIMTGIGKDGNRAYQDKGFLDSLSAAKITNFQNPASGQNDRWIDFNAPSDANNMTDDQIMSMIKPGTYGDTTITVDANGKVTYTKDKGMKWEVIGDTPVEVPDIEVTSFDKNQVIAHQRLAQMYQGMKEKYNADLAGGGIGTDNGQVPGGFRYVDPYASSIPGAEFDVPNPGGMSIHEFTYYKMMFDRSWSKWSLDKNDQWQDSSVWGNSMENAYKAKWEMFKTFMASMGESKIKDREFQEKLAKDSPEDLAALKKLAEQGYPFWVDGKKLTPEDIQKRIDKKIEDRQKILDSIKNGVIHIKLPADLEKLLNELSSMASGDVEIGVMPYSGSCGDTFSLFGFSQDALQLRAAINGLFAGGSTPMSPALYQARHALLAYGNGQSGLIILLCDGQNDCSENPVQAADNIHQSVFPANPGGVARFFRNLGREFDRFQLFPSLYAQGTSAPAFVPIDMNKPIPPGRQKMPITVSTVGFQVTADQQQVLDEIAKAGGGISGSAKNIDQLTQAFSSAIQSATQVIPGGGGGGGVVYIPNRTNWMTIVLAALAVLIVIMAGAILVVRNRRTAGPAASAPVYAILDVVYSDGGTKSFHVRGPTSIGRSGENALVIHDDMVSGRHAELVVSQSGYLIRDLGSANGTFVNGRQIGEQYLADGDQIKVGSTTLNFRPN
ncbi:MAG: FHA domain-containing protein [Candidatus Aminicenantes bacterium]|nr:FHA domain-containing protein [Candidatus Aminicenantes bacterium]